MKRFSLFPMWLAALALSVSCQKPQSDEERNAQIEREVQQRLAAQHQADEQQRMANQQADLDAREKAVAAREAAGLAATPTPRAVATKARSEDRTASSDRDSSPDTYDTFYRKLEPYGAWRETDDYGFVWQPREARARDWRPYTNGRWAYTDAGWTWVSEEPFGWATYHYGRWTRLQNVGWVWVPGEEWAPAWVSWRKGDQHIGWAPLPPEARFDRNTGIKKWADSYYDISADEYVFIPNEDIGADRIASDVIPVDRNVTIINETTNVTNITYNNTTIVNEGPNFDELRGRSRRPIERMRLERQGRIDRDEDLHARVSGAVISMVAPLFHARGDRPQNVGEPIRNARVERNWTNNANQPDAQRARAKLQSEATPPPNAPPKRFQKPNLVPGTMSATPAATAATPVATVAPTPEPTVSAAPIQATPPPAPTATVTATVTFTPRPRMTPPRVIAPRATPLPTAAATATPVASAPENAPAIPEVTGTPVRNFPPGQRMGRRRPPVAPDVAPAQSAAPATEAATPQAHETPETAAPAPTPAATHEDSPPPAGNGHPSEKNRQDRKEKHHGRGEMAPSPSNSPER